MSTGYHLVVVKEKSGRILHILVKSCFSGEYAENSVKAIFERPGDKIAYLCEIDKVIE